MRVLLTVDEERRLPLGALAKAESYQVTIKADGTLVLQPVFGLTTFTCTHCRMTSHNPHDLANRYCGNCHHFCDDVDVQRRPWPLVGL